MPVRRSGGQAVSPGQVLFTLPTTCYVAALQADAEERVRFQVCWGHFEGPRQNDVPRSNTVSTFIERPRPVARRLIRFAELVGRELRNRRARLFLRHIACRPPRVHPQIMWARFQALVDGASLASGQLWGG
jgi:hypothetical protein